VTGPCTVAKYLMVLEHELIRYDTATSSREAKRGRVNIYRTGLLMEALGRVRRDVGVYTSDSDADKVKLLAAVYSNFEHNFPPVKKLVKQMDAGICRIA
jgi:hypothetical protein